MLFLIFFLHFFLAIIIAEPNTRSFENKVYEPNVFIFNGFDYLVKKKKKTNDHYRYKFFFFKTHGADWAGYSPYCITGK